MCRTCNSQERLVNCQDHLPNHQQTLPVHFSPPCAHKKNPKCCYQYMIAGRIRGGRGRTKAPGLGATLAPANNYKNNGKKQPGLLHSHWYILDRKKPVWGGDGVGWSGVEWVRYMQGCPGQTRHSVGNRVIHTRSLVSCTAYIYSNTNIQYS